MEQQKQQKLKSINEILPLELIQRILLSVPVKHLPRLRCVSKLWHSLISDPHFAESHLHDSPSPTHAFLLVRHSTGANLICPEEVFDDNNYAIKEVSLPFKKRHPPSDFRVMGSCRGFVLLNRQPHFLVIWNPLTGGSSKKISYSAIVSRSKRRPFMIPAHACLYGFGYDASRDDYLVVVAWQDRDRQHHLDCFSLRANSWINLDSALPRTFGGREWQCCGLFLNGSIHWLSYSIKADSEALLVFDLKERTFSKIYVPEQLVTCHSPNLVLLGSCLALYSQEFGQKKTDIWVMKEYKVQSSWTSYEIPGRHLKPLCLSSNGDIIALDSIFPYGDLKFAKYNVRGELLQHFERPSRHEYRYPIDHANHYTESLLLFPSYRKHKDKKKKKRKKNVT